MICTANQLTSFYMRAILAFNGLTSLLLIFIEENINFQLSNIIGSSNEYSKKLKCNYFSHNNDEDSALRYISKITFS